MTSNKKKILKCNYSMFDVKYGLFDKLYIQVDTSAENKGLECTIPYNNIESRLTCA